MANSRGYYWPFLAFVLIVFIGFRYEVGADWFVYLEHLQLYGYYGIRQVLLGNDPGYYLLNWAAFQLDVEIWFVNVLSGILFSFGLIIFARSQPRARLAILVAIPYLVIVVAMGYARQAIAIGIVMLAIVQLMDRKILRYLLLIAVAATFHKTAIFMIVFSVVMARKYFVPYAILTGIFLFFFYGLFFASSVDLYVQRYLTVGMESQGAAIRVAMNSLPAALFLVFRRRFVLTSQEARFWTVFSMLAVAFVGLLAVSPSSTAVDRLALYLIPVQIFVLSRVPDAFGGTKERRSFYKNCVIIYSAAIQFVWLNFAAHAQYWLPYQFYPLI